MTTTKKATRPTENPKAKHGNRYDTGPSLSVAVGDCRGGWNNGHFSGDKALVDHARLAAEVNAQVNVYGAELTADANTPLGAYAAFASYSPGRIIIYGDAPQEIVDHMSQYAGDDVIVPDGAQTDQDDEAPTSAS